MILQSQHRQAFRATERWWDTLGALYRPSSRQFEPSIRVIRLTRMHSINVTKAIVAVRLCVCVFVTTVSSAKTDKPSGTGLELVRGTRHYMKARISLPEYRKEHFSGKCTRHPSDSGRVQSSHSPDATNNTQRGHYAAAMQPVACRCCYCSNFF